MARKKASGEEKEAEALLQGLRNALDGQAHLLRGTAAADALLPTAKTADAAAQKALDSGLLETVAAPAGVKATAKQQFARLTDRGRQFVQEHDPRQKLLETLLPIVQRLAEQFGGLADALGQTMTLLQAALGAPSGTAVAPLPTSPAAPAADLPAVLRRAYDRLRDLTDFRDGLVPLPRLYHEVLKTLPGLTVEEYHRALQPLWHDGQVELRVLNEVRTAREPEKAITRNDRLYYFLLWKTP